MPLHAIAEQKDELQAVGAPLPALCQPGGWSHGGGVWANEWLEVAQDDLRILAKRARVEIPRARARTNEPQRATTRRLRCRGRGIARNADARCIASGGNIDARRQAE